MMPKMRGPEFVRRALSLVPDAAVVFMSGYSEDDVLAEVKRSDCSSISKPFTIEQLLRVVRQKLDEKAKRSRSEQSA